MTKKSDKPDLSNDPRVQLFVYGLDEAGKPKGARFLMSEMETVAPVITAQKLQFFDGGSSEETVKLGMKLATGRIYARGKSFIPNIKRDLYDGILAALASAKTEHDPDGCGSVGAGTIGGDGYCSGGTRGSQKLGAGTSLRPNCSAADGFWVAAELGVDCGGQHGSGRRRSWRGLVGGHRDLPRQRNPDPPI